MRRFVVFPLTVLLLLALPTLASAQNAQKAVTQKLTDDVYTIFWGFYNSLVVITSEGVVITDPANPARAKILKQEIAKLTDKKVTRVILTHEHYDHVGGTSEFAGAQIICHRNCADVFRLDATGRAPKKVDLTYNEKLVLDYGGKRLELRYFGRADGAGMSVIYLPRERIVATADLYGPKFLTAGMWMEDKNYLGTRTILNWIVKQNVRYAIEAHHTNTDPAVVAENAAFVNDLHDAVNSQIRAAMKAGGPRAVIGLIGTLPGKLELPKYREWKGYKEHFPTHVRRMILAIFHGG